MGDLDGFRAQIDDLDQTIVKALARRYQVCEAVAVHKAAAGIPMMQPDRVSAVLERCAYQGARHGLPADYVRDLYRVIIDATCRHEDRVIERTLARAETGATGTPRQQRFGTRWDALVVHCPGPQRMRANPFHSQWDDAVAAFFADTDLGGSCRDARDLTLVTYNTRAAPQLLERCVAHLGLSAPIVLGQHLPDWRWEYKLTLVRDYLRSGACATPYVLCLDDDDTLLLGDPAEVVDRFEALGCDLLFCATRGDWPPDPDRAAFEVSVAGDADPAHHHLNAGAYVGRTDAVLAHLDEMVQRRQADPAWCMTEHGFDDQLAWRHQHQRHHPDLRVDTGCRVFLRFDEDR